MKQEMPTYNGVNGAIHGTSRP